MCTETAVCNIACWAHPLTHTHMHTHTQNTSICSCTLTPPGLHPASPQPLSLPVGHLQGGAGQLELPGVGRIPPEQHRTPTWYSLPTPVHTPSLLVAIALLGTALSSRTAHILSPAQRPPMRALSLGTRTLLRHCPSLLSRSPAPAGAPDAPEAGGPSSPGGRSVR